MDGYFDTLLRYCPMPLFLGLWALAAVMIAPFAWGWDDFGAPGDPSTWDDGAPKFNGAVLIAAVFAPYFPLLVVMLPLAILALLIVTVVPEYLKRWWNSDWSRR